MNMLLNNIENKQAGLPDKFGRTAILILIAGIILGSVSLILDFNRCIFASLILFLVTFSTGSGCLFLIALEYLTNAVWSTPIRRVAENLSSIILISPLFALPVFFNMQQVFSWARPEVLQIDKIIAAKTLYLNTPFFIIRTTICYIVMVIIYRFLTQNSLKQDDTGNPHFTQKNIKISAIFMVIFTIVTTLISVDWMMSLEPHWVSTIFGVYFFSGTVLAGFSVVTIATVILNETGCFPYKLVKDHYYSLGALLFAFTIFWAYIAFCQFLLIWYGNLPHETFWYLQRWDNNWKYFSIGIIFIHFFIPFLVLLNRKAKTNPKILVSISILILFSHFYDLFWIIMPVYSKDFIPFGLPEISSLILFCGMILTLFSFRARNKKLMPVRDPKFIRGINFRL